MFTKQIGCYLLFLLLFIIYCNKDNITGNITVTNNTDVAFEYTVEPSGWGNDEDDITTGSVENNSTKEVDLRGDCSYWSFICTPSGRNNPLSTYVYDESIVTIYEDGGNYMVKVE